MHGASPFVRWKLARTVIDAMLCKASTYRSLRSPGDLPPAQELYEQLAAVMGLQP